MTVSQKAQPWQTKAQLIRKGKVVPISDLRPSPLLRLNRACEVRLALMVADGWTRDRQMRWLCSGQISGGTRRRELCESEVGGGSVGLEVRVEVKGLEKRVPISNKYMCWRRRCRVRCAVQRQRCRV
jgi:hypothetical protein